MLQLPRLPARTTLPLWLFRALPIALLLSTLVTPALGAAPQRGGGGGGGGGGSTPPPADATVAFRKDDLLCLARADGSGQTVIGTMRPEGRIAWAGAGGPIFVETRIPSGIFKINADGTGQTLVVPRAATWPGGMSVNRGAPCPDGQRRIFYTELGTTGDAQDLWTARLDGSNRIRLTWNVPGQRIYDPMIAPTGDMLVVKEDIDLRLLVLGLVNGQLAVLSSQSLIADDPNHPLNPWANDWVFWADGFEDLTPANPSGTRFLFTAMLGLDTTTRRIYRMDVTTPSVVDMLPLPQPSVGSPSMTPNGQQLYYVSTNSSNRGSIYRANADGSGSALWINPGSRGNHRTPCTKP